MISFDRQERLYPETKKGTEYRRKFGQLDRDRLLYSSALRRLAGVTQVIDPAEGQIFHNRLTHTLKVAQISRRIAEKLIFQQPSECKELGGVDPDVVEAAALAHDLGHPPFGHVAETKLEQLVYGEKVIDGFEGNAQSFRIVNKLALRSLAYDGLNLCRATLNAILKYPWTRKPSGKAEAKWGVYTNEKEIFDWAREGFPHGSRQKSLEAEIMDWADDIAYSVSDLEDFYRAGLIPLDRLAVDDRERTRFYTEVFRRWEGEGIITNEDEKKHLIESFEKVMDLLPIEEPYLATRRRRVALRDATSGLINRYVNAPSLDTSTSHSGSLLNIDQQQKMEVKMLKQVTWHYVITNPALSRQQFGKSKVIEKLFKTFLDASKDSQLFTILPIHCQQELIKLESNPSRKVVRDKVRVRLVADVIACMTDNEALKIHERIAGISPGSIFDRLPR